MGGKHSIRISTFRSCWRLGNPHSAFSIISFSMVWGQENLPLIRLGVALKMVNAICGRSNRSVEVGRVDDVRLREPITGVG